MPSPSSRDAAPSRSDIEWAERAERHVFFALLAASTVGWALYALLTARSFYPLLVIRALIVGSCMVVVTAFVLAIPAQGILYLASPRYRSARSGGRTPPDSAPLTVWKFLAAWCVMLLVSVANGFVREFTYGRYMDELGAHQFSTACGVLLLGLVIRGFTRLYPPASARAALVIGLCWTALTVAFEFLFFHYAGGHSWSALLANYNLLNGRIWAILLLWIAVAPYVFLRLDRLQNLS